MKLQRLEHLSDAAFTMRCSYFLVIFVKTTLFRSTEAIGYADCTSLATSTPNDAVMYLGDCYRLNRTLQRHINLRDNTCPLVGGFLGTVMSEGLRLLIKGRITAQYHIGLEQEWNQTGLMDKWYWLGPNGLKYPVDWNASLPIYDITDGGGGNDETNGENYGSLRATGIDDVGNHNLGGLCQIVGPKRSYRLFRSGARIAYPIQYTMLDVATLTACIRKCNKHLTCMSLSFSSAKQSCIEHQLLANDTRVEFENIDPSFDVYSRVDV